MDTTNGTTTGTTGTTGTARGTGPRKLKLFGKGEGEFLVNLAGADPAILGDYPHLKSRYRRLGAAIIFGGAMAALSMAITLIVAFRMRNPLIIGVVAVGFGMLIANVDALLVSTARRQPKMWQTIGFALVRLLATVVIGLAMTYPVLLVAFSPGIRAVQPVLLQEQKAAVQKRISTDPRYVPIPAMQAQVDRLTAAADTTQGVDVSQDPAVAAATATVADLQKQSDAAEQAVICEKQGTCGSGVVGAGIAFAEKVQIRDRLRGQLGAAQQTLASASQSARQRLQANQGAAAATAKAQLPIATKQVQALVAARDGELRTSLAAIDGSDGLASQLEALGRLSDDHPVVKAAHWAIAGTLMIIDCLPVLAKLLMLLGAPSLYDKVQATREEAAQAQETANADTLTGVAKAEAGTAIDAAEADRDLASEIRALYTSARLVSEHHLAAAQLGIYEQHVLDDIRDNPGNYIVTEPAPPTGP